MRDFDAIFPDLRIEGDTTLRSCQLVMLRLLKIFDRICEEEGLHYWLDGGTLLGAVRHGGFIPWDDDIDVMMPMEDYRSFLKIAQDLLPYDVFLQTRESDPAHSVPWAKLRDRFGFMEDPGGPYAFSQGIPIDIFPALLMTRRRSKHRKLFALLPPAEYGPAWPLSTWSLKHKLYSGGIAFLQAIALPFLRSGPLSRAIAAWGNRGEPMWAHDYRAEWTKCFPEASIYPLKRIRFEDALFSAPADPADYLRRSYGPDYMTPPPESERGAHAVQRYLITGPNPHFSGLRWEDYAEKKRAAAGKFA